MPTMDAQGLAAFVRTVDEQCAGRLDHPLLSQYYPIHFEWRTPVDEDLDPFSEAYVGQQIALYREISGRELDQASGELHRENIERLVDAPNPLGLQDPPRVAELVRTLSTMLAMVAPPPGSRVLDMGAGHGLSSEVFAFCGCKVDAVDIDPLLGELSRRRSARRGFDVTRHALNFEDLSSIPDGSCHAAFFFQSLHHAIRPWEVIAQVRRKLVDGGVIAFAGEPIQSHVWRNWGLRLDQESLYVARAFGWFESGWSEAFITECFRRNGMALKLVSGGHDGGAIGIASAGSLDALLERARRMDHEPPSGEPLQFLSQIGTEAQRGGRKWFDVIGEHGGGYLLYGPYTALRPGEQEFSFELEGSGDNVYTVDVTADGGAKVLRQPERVRPGTVTRRFEVPARATGIEIRLHVAGTQPCGASWPRVRQPDGSAWARLRSRLRAK